MCFIFIFKEVVRYVVVVVIVVSSSIFVVIIQLVNFVVGADKSILKKKSQSSKRVAVAAATPAPIKPLAAFDLMALLAPDLILSLVSSSTRMKCKIIKYFIS